MIPYSRPKFSDLYTLSQRKLLENHTLHSGTYLYSPYMNIWQYPPGGGGGGGFAAVNRNYDHKQRTLKHRKTQNGSESTNHRSQTMTFWARLRLTTAKNENVSWLLSLTELQRVFKSAVTKKGLLFCFNVAAGAVVKKYFKS